MSKIENHPLFGKVHIIAPEIGRAVICDICNDDLTDSDAGPGLMFSSSYAVCPSCEPDWRKSVEKHKETHLIRNNETGKSFADWIRDVIR